MLAFLGMDHWWQWAALIGMIVLIGFLMWYRKQQQ